MVTLSIQIRQASCTSLRHLINVSATIQLRKLLMHWKMRKLALMMNGVKEPSAKKKEAAPLCLKVTLQLIREGRFQSLDQCLAHEYCTSPTGISKRVSNDFSAVGPFIIRKVSKDMVDSYFSQLMELEPDLELPTTLQGMLDANDWGHLQTGMVRVLEDTGDLLPFIFALLVCSIIAAGAGI
ncbi:hypothetical protein NC653_017866 [Populus alba x Populus x berolinensis]|uniref:3-hydroxyisobutyryl-CoA hydrolase n=1 Tax=Populus alba x Populus x berolinensis TaxID=444605 RepID=A0AAD6QRA5_9ROSI|nr:hypothetical protein NC653_017866 [Populus alba x Populus x berolinensis]